MKGQRLFNEIIKDRTPGDLRKGRNNSLVTKRNDCMLARYYYYGHFKDKCYEDILRQLVAEFFLSPNTIASIILENAEAVQSLKQKKYVVYYFQSHWPHLKW